MFVINSFWTVLHPSEVFFSTGACTCSCSWRQPRRHLHSQWSISCSAHIALHARKRWCWHGRAGLIHGFNHFELSRNPILHLYFFFQVGEDVSHVKVGDRVYFLANQSGSAAEYCLTDCVFPLPSGNLTGPDIRNVLELKYSSSCFPDVPFQQGACLGIPYMTAHRALFLFGQLKVSVLYKT